MYLTMSATVHQYISGMLITNIMTGHDCIWLLDDKAVFAKLTSFIWHDAALLWFHNVVYLIIYLNKLLHNK